METFDRMETAGVAEAQWKGIYGVGGVAAIVMAVFIPLQLTVFVIWPPPVTVTGWFALFQQSNIVGLLDMDLLLVLDQVLLILVFLALYFALKDSSRSFMIIAVVLGIGGALVYFASTSAFEMLSLSGKFTAATTEEEKSVILAAGEVMLANWQGTAFNVSYIMAGVGLLITAVVMVRSNVFGKTTAYIGLVLGIMALVPPTAGMVGMMFALGSLLPLEVWDILVGRRLLQMAAK